MCVYIFVYVYLILIKIANQHTDMQIRHFYECLWCTCMPMTAGEKMLAGNADASYLDADPDAS